MTGRLYERNGKYHAVLYYKDKNKKKARLWRCTGYEIKGNKKKAEAKLAEFIEENRHLEYNESDAKRILFTEAIRQWLERKQNKVELSTYEGYTVYVNRHIIPYFEKLNLYLDEVTPKHIRDYYEYKFRTGRLDNKEGGLNVQSIKKHSVILKQVFADALIAEQVIRNPAVNVPLPKQEQDMKAVFLTQNEANKLLQAFRGHELQAIVYVTLYYGLRRSEALGLRWNAIDFDNDTLTINHTVVKNLSIVYKDRTKSRTSTRTFPLLSDVKDLLLHLKKQQNENRKIFGDTYTESDYIFVWQDGKLYRPDYITRTFQNVLKKHGLKPMRYHDLRHCTASILYDKGWDLKDIQNWLGHADIETTGNIYTHISEQRKQVTAKSLEKTFII